MSERLDNLLQGFSDDQLPARLQAFVAPFRTIANEMATRWGEEPEVEDALVRLQVALKATLKAAITIKERKATEGEGGT